LKGKGYSDKAGSSLLRDLSARFDPLAGRGIVAAKQFCEVSKAKNFVRNDAVDGLSIRYPDKLRTSDMRYRAHVGPWTG
jgi:hypothetical protein